MKEVHHDAAKVLIDETLEVHEAENILTGFHRCTVITVNGEMWAKAFLPFGLQADSVIADWNLRDLRTWIKTFPCYD